VEVRGIGAGGSGIADLPDGRVVFVPRTTEGDRARIRVERIRPRWARGSLVEVLDPASSRVNPPCKKYAECGGCQLQHVSYEDQLTWKGRFITDALARIGGLGKVSAPEVVPSPSRLRYRNRVSFTLRRLSGGHVVAGFHALHRPAHIVDIDSECLLPHEKLSQTWSKLRAGWGKSAELLPSAGRIRMTLGLSGENGAEVDLVVEGGRSGWDGERLFKSVGAVRAIWHRPSENKSAGEERDRMILAGGGVLDAPTPTFAQVNDEAAELLRTHVIKCCTSALQSNEQVALPTFPIIDAYCGSGAYGSALASEGLSVVGIESDPSAVEQARASVRAKMAQHNKEFGCFEVQEGLVEDLLPALLPAEVLVFNPPRSGLHEDVPAQILANAPRRILYVSCDPATLARDVKRLGDQYALDRLRAFDLFPQTAHVEAVAELTFRGVAQ